MPDKIFVASKSPRRRELLHQIGVKFELLMFRSGAREDAELSEATLPAETPLDYVQRIAASKANGGWERMTLRGMLRAPVLGADTTVCIGDTIFGKPEDEADALRILSELSGRKHRVLTSVALRWQDELHTAVSESVVKFRTLSADEIRRYIATSEPMDKAGAYGVQGRAAVFIERIEGSYSGIMGLPLFETSALLAKVGLGPS